MTFEEHIQEKIYNGSPGRFQKPQYLYHENMVQGDMLANYSQWDDINEFIPLRPQGNFFWGEEMAEPKHCQIKVFVNNLDTDFLYAFPSALAQEADELVVMFRNIERKSPEAREELEAMRDALACCQPVPYDKYEGQFAAEWIYSQDIPFEFIENVFLS